MTRIVAVHGVLPSYRYPQEQITGMVAASCRLPREDLAVLERLHSASTVTGRHLVLPLERYTAIGGFGVRNDAFLAAALELGREAVQGALDQAGLAARDIDLVVSTSVTGIAAPSLEARLAGELGLRPDVKRVPVFGLGCVAGAAGLARLHDYLVGHPDEAALLLSVELCSLTLQRSDTSMQNLVASALFGDGAAAAVAVGSRYGRAPDEDPASEGPHIVATRSHLFPGTEEMLGWTIGDTGFHIMLGADLPDLVRGQLGGVVTEFLADHDLKTTDLASWICHPGGPKVLDAVREALDLPARALEATWRSLAEVGNLSSASVLHILRDTLAGERPLPGTPGLLLAMGPGFCVELVLLRW
ncbi:type III polyketide synthase [Streptomyces tateyamensis]|uniref:Type III polyketide synthase n=1 Tax=Streptomyces tateyamensis TaxID=565073 RepID=A0A2V4NL58_9ACTN|nr:3-oxoacyl-[acyl-carrier-protein] synthase III C-terminal domain-containing protein [Streptomyces tateyamensis]PYC83190.1 type III polyketide synthase [Streptomyces tateyamensis]